MSWSANFTLKAGQTEPREEDLNLTNVNEVPEHLEQFREALSAAFGILLSGVLGNNDKDYHVVLGGHGNTDHEPVQNRSTDFLTVSIAQLGKGLEDE